MIALPVVHAGGITHDGLTIPQKSGSVIVPVTAVVVVELITQHEAEVPLSVLTPLCREVDGEQVIEDGALDTEILYLTLGVIGRTQLSDSLIAGGIGIDTSLLTEGQFIVVAPVQFRAEL